MPDNRPARSPQQKDTIATELEKLKRIQLNSYKQGVRRARNALFIAAILIALSQTAIMYTRDEFDDFTIMLLVIICGSFALCAFWTKTKPYSALIAGITAFIFYLLIDVIATALVNGADGIAKWLVSGLIFKIGMLVILIRPLKDAKELQDAAQEQ